MLRAENLEPGLMGEFYVFKGELKEFPVIAAEQKPVVKAVARFIGRDTKF